MDGSMTVPRLAGSAPPPVRPIWTLKRLDDRQNPMPQIIQAAYEQPVVRQNTPIGAFYVVADPEGVKRVLLDNVANYPKTEMERRFFSVIFGDGLISSEGDTWRAHRRTMAPAFAPPSVAAYAPAMVEEAMAFRDRWDQQPPDAPVDVARDMTRLTLQIIARTMFSTDGSALAAVMEDAIAGGMATLQIGLLDFVPGLDRLRLRAREARVGKSVV